MSDGAPAGAAPPVGPNLKRRALRSSAVTAVSQIVIVALQFASQIVLARLLFPADFGLVAMISPVIGFIRIFNDLGLGQVIIQRVSMEQANLSALFWINMALSCGLAVVAAAVSPLVALGYHEPRITALMIALALMLPVAALGVHPTALLTREMRFGLLGIDAVAGTIAQIAVTVALAWLGFGYWSLVAGQLASTITTNLLGWAQCGWWPSRPRRLGTAWADLKFGGNITGANLATYFITSADNVIIGATSGEEALGFYDRSYRLVVQPVNQAVAPISRVALPLLCRLTGNPDAYRAAYLQIARAMLLLTVPGMLVCITNADVLIPLFLGERWRPAVPIFAWICVGGLTSAIYTSATWLFVSQERTREMRNTVAIASVINLASFLIGSIWGVVAVARAAALTFVVITTPLVLYSATRAGPIGRGAIAALAATFAIEGAIVFALLRLQAGHAALDGVAQVATALLIAYVGFGLLTLLIPGERRAMLAVLRIALGDRIGVLRRGR